MATSSTTTSEHIENKVNTNVINNDDKKKEENENLQSTTNDQGDKTKEKIDDINQIDKKDSLSSIQSSNENNQSDQTNLTSDKKNDEKMVDTTTKQESVTSSNDIKKEESSTPSSDLNKDKKKENEQGFPIEKGDAQHLTDFQRQKAKYFFHVNLDIENKEFLIWENVEFYLLFHATAAGKDGSDGGDIVDRLSRAARAFWEHVHDQIPLAEGTRDRLTLDQFLDTWASLIDYVVRTNQLPPIIQDLVKLGFELYSTDTNGDQKTATIQPAAFEQLFQKTNLGRPFAIMAYGYLTEKGTKPLDADKIDSIVKAVITSSDDEHDSHFLLPGFFKTITNGKQNDNKNKDQPSSPVSEKEQPQTNDKSSSTSTTSTQEQKPTEPSSPSSSQSQTKNDSSPTLSREQKPAAAVTTPPSTPSQSQQQTGSSSPLAQGQKPDVSTQKLPSSPPPSKEQKPASPPTIQKQQSNPNAPNEGIKTSPPSSTTNQQQQQQQNTPPAPQKLTIEQEDESIRRLLHYYHIDDGDLVEILGGSPHRLVLVHPERPLPPYIQQNKNLLQKLHLTPTNTPSNQQSISNIPTNKQETTETKPKVTLEERLSRGEAQKGPTVPVREEQKQGNVSSGDARQVYPPLSEEQQEEQRKQAKLQATQSPTEENSTASKPDESNEKKDVTRDDEDKIIAAVLNQLKPIIEQRVAAELRRLHSGKSDQSEDDDYVPFPFIFTGGNPFFAAPRGGPPSQGSGQQQNETGQGNGATEGDFGGPGSGPTFIPPQLVMAMMSDLARGGMGGNMSGFPPNMPPPHLGPGGVPIGVEGFMMFVDDDQMMDGPGRHF